MVKQFCESILRTGTRRSKALANLVMGLGSQVGARSTVEVSLSRVYHYQYSSISKSIDVLDKPFKKAGQPKETSDQLSRRQVEKKFAIKGRSLCQAV